MKTDTVGDEGPKPLSSETYTVMAESGAQHNHHIKYALKNECHEEIARPACFIVHWGGAMLSLQGKESAGPLGAQRALEEGRGRWGGRTCGEAGEQERGWWGARRSGECGAGGGEVAQGLFQSGKKPRRRNGTPSLAGWQRHCHGPGGPVQGQGGWDSEDGENGRVLHG